MTLRATTPVALVVFNRPSHTARVLSVLSRLRPQHLLVIADGPRAEVPSDASRCADVLGMIRERVGWGCRVDFQIADRNLGCGPRVASGLDWVFSKVEEAVILEDDCVPEDSFFAFCEELLCRFRNNPRVMHIGGTRFAPPGSESEPSYYFSRYPHIWGWATWRRAWQHYQFRPAGVAAPDLRPWLVSELRDGVAARYWSGRFANLSTRPHTWDHQWVLACWRRSGLCIVPETNLITNVGFGPDATHPAPAGRAQPLPVHPIRFPLRHPRQEQRDVWRDDWTQRHVYRMGWLNYTWRNWRTRPGA